jgi:hypothetical protein
LLNGIQFTKKDSVYDKVIILYGTDLTNLGYRLSTSKMDLDLDLDLDFDVGKETLII